MIDALVDLTLLPVVTLGTGVVLAVASCRAWTGRSTAWARQPLWATLPIHGYPALAVMCLYVGLEGLLDTTAPAWVPVTVGLVVVTGAALYLLAVFGVEPRWATLAWLHDADRSPDVTGDEVTALLYLASTSQAGRAHASKAEVDQAFAGQPRWHRWGASLVTDPGADTAAHVLAGPGAVSGRVSSYPTGLAFHAAAVEEQLRQQGPAHLIVPADALRAVWTVPPGADADGRQHTASGVRARAFRSPYRRLVVATASDGVLLFELWGARKRADDLASRYGITRGPDIR